jgi:hypothetical protein
MEMAAARDCPTAHPVPSGGHIFYPTTITIDPFEECEKQFFRLPFAVFHTDNPPHPNQQQLAHTKTLVHVYRRLIHSLGQFGLFWECCIKDNAERRSYGIRKKWKTGNKEGIIFFTISWGRI